MKGNRNGNGAPESTASRILVLDDEPEMLKNYERLLKRAGHDCLASTDPTKIDRLLEEFRPELVITDLMMPHVSGMEVLQRVRAWDSGTPVILVTAYGSIESAVQAMKHHAADFLVKPFSMDELLQKVQEALSYRLIERVQDLPPEAEASPGEGLAGIIGVSAPMQVLYERLRKVARMDVNVLVTGESGTGKELVARAVHSLSPRRNEICVPIDCASLPENLLESELFGYVKGSFTGAHMDKKGLLEFAHKGTLFLDEVGELPPALQVKLLRVLQERSFRPIGGRQQVEVSIRVVAATNRNLEEEVKNKTFRSDLFYRLNVVGLHLPPLRERHEDIALLANHFLRTFTQDQHLPPMRILPETMEVLRHYDWPGNVRELQNCIEHAATMASGTELCLRDLPPDIVGDTIELASKGDASFFEEKDRLVSSFEREYLVNLLADNQFNISRAAEVAGCHRRTLYRMIQRYRINLKTIQEERSAMRALASAEKRTTPDSQ
jgi:DNA-binding NtrC family response regulator